MRFFSVEISPSLTNPSGWEVYCGPLPLLDNIQEHGPHEEGFYIAPESKSPQLVFDTLRADMIARYTAEINELSKTLESLTALKCPEFEPLTWNEVAPDESR
jgi:hypothetical protein